MEMLGRYQLTTALSNQNAGSCQWCFATLQGRDYFIKEFLEPKYPAADTTSSAQKIEKKLQKCGVFEQKKTRIYEALNTCSDGNAVRVTDFFRIGSKYYMAMPRIRPVKMDIPTVAGLAPEVRRRLCAVIAHSMAQLHSKGLVHADVKHSNIMLTHSGGNQLTAKVIDYDAGYFESDPPKCAEEVAGDQVYFSPEAWAFMLGEEAQLTCKLDVFALGVLFHQYLTGQLPRYDTDSFTCTGEAVQQGAKVEVSNDMPPELHRLLCRMLDADPAKRPTAQEVHRILVAPEREPEPKPPVPQPDIPFQHDALARSGFHSLGDL